MTTLAQGVAAAQPNDTIILDQGAYTDQTAIISVPLTIVGAGAILSATQPLANEKGILVGGANLNVNNITFWGAEIPVAEGNNGAGIRMETGNLTVTNCRFNDNQDGILADPNAAASITISNSSFVGNGAGEGFSHAVYLNAVALLTVTNSYFFGHPRWTRYQEPRAADCGPEHRSRRRHLRHDELCGGFAERRRGHGSPICASVRGPIRGTL